MLLLTLLSWKWMYVKDTVSNNIKRCMSRCQGFCLFFKCKFYGVSQSDYQGLTFCGKVTFYVAPVTHSWLLKFISASSVGKKMKWQTKRHQHWYCNFYPSKATREKKDVFTLTAVSRFFWFIHRPENQPENFKRWVETPFPNHNELFFDQTKESGSILQNNLYCPQLYKGWIHFIKVNNVPFVIHPFPNPLAVKVNSYICGIFCNVFKSIIFQTKLIWLTSFIISLFCKW